MLIINDAISIKTIIGSRISTCKLGCLMRILPSKLLETGEAGIILMTSLKEIRTRSPELPALAGN